MNIRRNMQGVVCRCSMQLCKKTFKNNNKKKLVMYNSYDQVELKNKEDVSFALGTQKVERLDNDH